MSMESVKDLPGLELAGRVTRMSIDGSRPVGGGAAAHRLTAVLYCFGPRSSFSTAFEYRSGGGCSCESRTAAR
jgi:hypothetical protein